MKTLRAQDGQLFPEQITVHVTTEDIRGGQRGKCTACPVALAMQRALPNSTGHFAGYGSLAWVTGGNKFSANPPRSVTNFMAFFDACGDVPPKYLPENGVTAFSFTIHVDDIYAVNGVFL